MPCPFRPALLTLLLALAAIPVGLPAHAADSDLDAGRLTLMDENDKFASHDDRHYTQGAAASYLSRPVTTDGTWDKPYQWLGDALPVFDGPQRTRKYDVTIGQSIFTPTNTDRVNPSPRDRPYAAWLYAGIGLLQDTDRGDHHTLENMELQAGTVGPAALGDLTQNDFHRLIGTGTAKGWHEQLKDEPGVMATYERKWRYQQPLVGNFAVDAIPELGGTVGNIMTYAQAGGIVRLGQNLGADYGPRRIRPSVSGTSWFDPHQMDGRLGWYVFGGTQVRAVARNIFLDGNTFTDSPSVDKKPLVADLIVGASVFWTTSWRADFTVTQRTKEFDGQRGHPDRFGGINVTFGF